MNYYVTPEQEKWLLANGLKPYCPEKGITLLEAAQWFLENYSIECKFDWNFDKSVNGVYLYPGKNFYTLECSNSGFNTIPEALSWAIDQAINHVNNQSNEQ